VISRLAGLAPAHVEVVAATSSFAYEGRRRTAREIGRELRVEYVVEGTFHRVDGEPRLDVRLVDTEADAVVWSDTYPADDSRLDTLARTVADGVARTSERGLHGSSAPPCAP
jgi:TolB-like protein